MTRLTFDAYLDHIGSESARFRSVLGDADPTARVPACPDWDAADLLWHLTEVQWFWSRIVAGRPSGPETLTHPDRPGSYDALLGAFDEASADLRHALAVADPAEHAWSWAPEQTVGFIARRQAHEALIHRLDAEQTCGSATPLDSVLAADGVAEGLGVIYGGVPDWGRFTPDGRHVRVDLTDTDTTLWVALGRFTGRHPDTGVEEDEIDLALVDDPGTDPDAVLRADAGTADAWLWDRSPADAVQLTGEPGAVASLTEILDQPLN
ncbi:maleylpyruvate isomerase family mycothiol-dependent enzyme [Nocardioides sp.]|uniref:maleylpyruvate isomerase family mycothiol-dependent enzyme n=1 Tax=Nocardioides sp. TaxID=35761 RepID=UPI002B26C698|nr:maleylpyruvate isomerase family mycothiol-dependent enzyme [Nocardioides sp.]